MAAGVAAKPGAPAPAAAPAADDAVPAASADGAVAEGAVADVAATPAVPVDPAIEAALGEVEALEDAVPMDDDDGERSVSGSAGRRRAPAGGARRPGAKG